MFFTVKVHQDVLFHNNFSMSFTDREKTRSELQKAAHAAAKRRDFDTAIDLYGQAIDIYVEDNAKLPQCLLLSQRANVNFELLRFELALNDSVAAIELLGDCTSTKLIQARGSALHAAGRAAYHMRLFEKSLTFFESAQALVPNDRTVAMLGRVRARLEEESTGTYDFEQMLGNLIKNPNVSQLDHASFISNTEIRTTAACGRGLFATKDFQLGDLVLCEKAFAIEFQQDDPSDQLPILQSQVVQILKYSPVAKDQFYTLTDGETGPAKHPGYYSFP